MAQDTGAPLSAIDWLYPAVPSIPHSQIAPPTRPAQAAAKGLFDPTPFRFDDRFWTHADPSVTQQLGKPMQSDAFTSMKRLRFAALLARLPSDNTILRRRVQALYDLGALDLAWALLEDQKGGSAEDFALAWNIGLLAGQSKALCSLGMQSPDWLSDPAQRVYCLAHTDQWQAAVTSYFAYQSLGTFDPHMDALLATYLEPEFEITPAEANIPAAQMTALGFVLAETAGYMQNSQDLPLPYAAATVRTAAAWRARLHAGERLARVGSLTPNQMLGLYIEQTPAASGSIWDRADAMQFLRRTIEGDHISGGAAQVLWDEMQTAGLTSTVAEIFGPSWADLEPGGDELPILQKFALLSDHGHLSVTDTGRITLRLWRTNLNFGNIDTRAAIAKGLQSPVQTAKAKAADIVKIFQDASLYIDGDHAALTRALTDLRRFGLQDIADRLAIEALVIGPRKS